MKNVATTIKIYPNSRPLLEDLVKERVKNHSLIKTQEAIVADLIAKAHESECKERV